MIALLTCLIVVDRLTNSFHSSFDRVGLVIVYVAAGYVLESSDPFFSIVFLMMCVWYVYRD